MTEQEAKRRLEVWLKCGDCPEDKQCYDSHLHSTCEYSDYCDETPISEAVKVAIKALERERKKYERERHCDCCGVLLTEENNTCGYELCDECNERLEQSMERSRNDYNTTSTYLYNNTTSCNFISSNKQKEIMN